MRVLFIAPYVPSLIRVRPYHLLKGLVRRGHEVVLAALWTDCQESAGLREMATGGIPVRAFQLARWRSLLNCLIALPTRMPFQSAYSWQPALASQVASEIQDKKYDVVHVEHLRGAFYGIRALHALKNAAYRGRKRIPVVWDSVDCITHLFRQAGHQSRSLAGRWMPRVDLSRTRSCEAWLAGQFDRVLLTSPVDSRALQRLAESRGISISGRLRVLSNGVDLEYFSAADTSRDSATLVMTGKMSYHANVTAAKYLVEEIMPLVWSSRPDAKVMIVGKDPPREIRSLEARCGFSEANGCGRRVTVTGTVRDIRPFLGRATVAVAPLLYGAGVQNKVLEAMACATPVIASPEATASLHARDGRDLLVGEGPPSFARNLLTLLEDPALRSRLALNGRRYVETFHNWDTVTASLESVYLEAIDANTSKHACA